MNRVGYIAAILVVVSTFLVYTTRKQPNETTLKKEQKIQKVSVTSTDTDSDTLKDWEETLWGTNPKVKDTDGDGTNDGEEVLVGRDPRVKGPKDALDTEISSPKLSPIATTKLSGPKYTETPSKNDNNQPSQTDPRKQFANSLAILLNSFTKSTLEDAKTLDKATKQLSPEHILALKGVAERYFALSKQIDELPWPNIQEKPQNGLVNSYISIGNAFQALSSYHNEGKIPVEAIKQYNQVSITQLEALVDIAHFFKNQGVVFNSSDPGYIFTNLSAIIRK